MATSNSVSSTAVGICWQDMPSAPVAENYVDMSKKAEEHTDASQDEGVVQGDRSIRMDHVG